MSIQKYFTHKKQLIVQFCSQLQHLIGELSVVVQLQIDNQYIISKKFIKDQYQQGNLEFIQQYCGEMKMGEGRLLGVMIDNIVAFFRNKYIDISNNGNALVRDIKIQPQHNIKSHTKSQSTLHNNSSLSALHPNKRIQQSQISTIKKQSKPQKQPNQNSNTNRNTKQRSSSLLHTTNKPEQPIKLLNKLCKKQKNWQQGSNRTNNFISADGEKQKQRGMRRNYSQSINYNTYKANMINNNQQNNKMYLQRNRSSEINKTLFKTQQPSIQQKIKHSLNLHIQQNPYIQHTQMKHTPNNIKGIPQNNKIEGNKKSQAIDMQICQQLDKKIHDSAIDILNKVKLKRSPIKKKNYETQATKDKIGGSSILDISNSFIPISNNFSRNK